MSDSEQQLLAVVDSLYESALNPTQWSSAMRSVANFADAAGTFYFIADQVQQRIVHSELQGLDPSANDQYLAYYGAKDMRLAPALKYPVGRELTEEMLVDWRAFRKSELFVDLLTPHDIPRILGFWVTKRDDSASAFVYERSGRQGVFERRDIERCAQLTPHLIRAIRTREALTSARHRERIYADLLDRLPFATLLLGADLNVIEASSAARSLLREGQPLRCLGRRVKAADAADDARLQAVLARTVASSRHAGGGTLTLRRSDKRPSITVTVIPVPAPDVFVDLRPAVMLLISDPLSAPRQPTDALRKALSLTDAEALLATALFKGVTLRRAADELRISINTCKSQLKSIYAKTGCRSHADLVRTVFSAALGSSAQPRSAIDERA